LVAADTLNLSGGLRIQRAKRDREETVLKGFRDFVLRGNVVDMAVGIIIGAAFNTVVSSLVKDIFNPLIASTVGKPNVGAIVFNFHGGTFEISDLLNAAISFLIVAGVVYFCVVLPMQYFVKKLNATPPPPTKKTCTECLSEIPLQAKRCAHCGQPQAVLEAQPVPEPEPATSAVAG
jgi:large conductance mechanosensitive channel